MTCREKLEIEYPEDANIRLIGDCPDDYGYAGEPKYCNPFVGAEECERCWNRVVEEIKQEKEKKKMTVEELVQVLDKNRRFIIRACHTDKTIFHPVKDEEKWEMFRRKEVVQFTPVEDGIIIYVAPPVRKDS